MVDVASTALELLRLYGPLALFLFTFLESSMLFPFLPSEVVVPAAAAVIVTGPVSFAVFLLAAGVGGTVGAFVPYRVFRKRETGWFREYVRVSDERAERGREWFLRWGQSSVLWGRFLPALRSVVSIPAGLVGMSRVRFGAYTAVGTVAFYAAAGAVVYYGRQRALFAVAWDVALERPAVVVAVAVVVLVAAVLARRGLRRATAR